MGDARMRTHDDDHDDTNAAVSAKSQFTFGKIETMSLCYNNEWWAKPVKNILMAYLKWSILFSQRQHLYLFGIRLFISIATIELECI